MEEGKAEEAPRWQEREEEKGRERKTKNRYEQDNAIRIKSIGGNGVCNQYCVCIRNKRIFGSALGINSVPCFHDFNCVAITIKCGYQMSLEEVQINFNFNHKISKWYYFL